MRVERRLKYQWGTSDEVRAVFISTSGLPWTSIEEGHDGGFNIGICRDAVIEVHEGGRFIKVRKRQTYRDWLDAQLTCLAIDARAYNPEEEKSYG